MSDKRNRYLQLKHEFLNSCGQCIGFRARGIDLEKKEDKAPCSPGVDCHKTCPALGMGGVGKVKTAESLPVETVIVEAVGQKEQNLEMQNNLQHPEKNYLAQTCFRCGASEDNQALLPCRHKGESLWVCTRCLPALIHG